MDFRQMYAGRLFLEVLLVRGINDNEENLRRLGDYVAGLRPDRIDVSTMTRPGSERQAGPADGEILERFRSVLGDRKTRERKRSPSATKDIFRTDDPERIKEQVLASLSRRPQTAADLASALDLHEAAVLEALEDLTASGAITAEDQGERFYHGPF
jgi:wyosine [tRNA(Phe)-imidazoG37] synthetase (radical SAM superfamily)